MGLKITAAIPTYNRRPYISRAIDSVLAQTVPVDEIIVVDDGSTDGTPEFLKNTYSGRLRVIVQKNKGVSAARHLAIEEAQGEWVAFLDSDDEWLPERNRDFLEATSAVPESVAWIVGDTRLMIDEGEADTLFSRSGIAISECPHLFGDSLSLHYPHFFCMLQSSVIKADVLRSLGCFREGFRASGDVLAAIQVASKYDFAAISSVVTKWYITRELRGSSIMRSGKYREDHCRATIECYASAAKCGGVKPWVDLYENSVRELCKLHAEGGMPIRSEAFKQFRFRISLRAIVFTCAALLGPAFVRAGVVAKTKIRNIFGQKRPEWLGPPGF
jgi:glycosyltransferase involved in cell wall biosynthesis